MTTLVLTGGDLITPLEHRLTNLWINRQLIEDIADGSVVGDVLDVSGCLVTPGLFDIQVNGGPDCNLWADPDPAQLRALRESLVSSGTTSFLPTLITDELEHLTKNLSFIESSGAGEDEICLAGTANGTDSARLARMPGIHLEGPCLSPQRPGVHPTQWLKPLSSALLQQLIRPAVKLVTLAPEMEPSGESIKFLLEKNIKVSLGHSNATFEEANLAFQRGVRIVTHTFNALPPIHHRAPGAVTAALLDDRVFCCLIADGLHLNSEAVKLVTRLKRADKTILVTDAAYTGTSQGGLSGSSITLDEAVRSMVRWKAASFEEAVRMASWNPALALGLDDRLGHLAPGKLADIVVWDKQSLKVKHVILGGRLMF